MKRLSLLATTIVFILLSCSKDGGGNNASTGKLKSITTVSSLNNNKFIEYYFYDNNNNVSKKVNVIIYDSTKAPIVYDTTLETVYTYDNANKLINYTVYQNQYFSKHQLIYDQNNQLIGDTAIQNINIPGLSSFSQAGYSYTYPSLGNYLTYCYDNLFLNSTIAPISIDTTELMNQNITRIARYFPGTNCLDIWNNSYSGTINPLYYLHAISPINCNANLYNQTEFLLYDSTRINPFEHTKNFYYYTFDTKGTILKDSIFTLPYYGTSLNISSYTKGYYEYY